MSRMDRGTGTRNRVLLVSLIAAVAVAIIAALIMSVAAISGAENISAPKGGAPGSQSSPTVTPSPAVTSAPGSIDEDVITTVLTSYLDLVATIPPDTDDVASALGSVAGDAVVAELESLLRELDSNDWTTTGKATVSSAKVVSSELKDSPPSAVVEACIDSSSVSIVDANGDPVGDASQTANALNLYTFQQREDQSWVLISHSFPNDPAC